MTGWILGWIVRVGVVVSMAAGAALTAGRTQPQTWLAWIGRDALGLRQIVVWTDRGVERVSPGLYDNSVPAWSADGRLAWRVFTGSNADIFVWDDGTVYNASATSAAETYPVWADDGRLLLRSNLGGGYAYYLAHADGLRPLDAAAGMLYVRGHPLTWTDVVLTPPVTRRTIRLWDGVAFTELTRSLADGEQPVWARGRMAWAGVNRQLDIFVYDDGKVTQVTDDGAMDNAPAWSPDGRLLAWHSTRSGNTEIYLWDGVNTVNLSQDGREDTRPAWSPDGRLAWETRRWGRTRTVVVWDGVRQTRLPAFGGDAANPTWSPDGTLAYTVMRDRQRDVVLWDGVRTVRLGADLGDVCCLVWSP